jgi:hypothetical protein
MLSSIIIDRPTSDVKLLSMEKEQETFLSCDMLKDDRVVVTGDDVFIEYVKRLIAVLQCHGGEKYLKKQWVT